MEKLLTVREVAKELKVNVNFVYTLLKNNEIPYLKLGSYKIRQYDLDNFIVNMVGKEAVVSDGRIEYIPVNESEVMR